jgi:hypothetical protein
MSLLTTIPEELIAAATQLEGIGTSLTAQNAAAAAPTTGIAPAAADSVSQLQAGIFSAYGTLYQQFAAEAQAIQQQFTATLGLSSGTYSQTEAQNAAQSTLTQLLDNIANLFQGGSSSYNGGTTSSGPFSFSGNSANFLSDESGNWASAMSDCLGMAGGGLIPADGPLGLGNLAGTAGDSAAVAGAADVNQIAPAGGMGMGGMGAGMPAGLGQATMVSSMSTAPSWAGNVTSVGATTGVTPITTGWTGAAPQAGAPIAAMPGMPGAGAGRGSALGAPRYGVKPIVMPKPTAV